MGFVEAITEKVVNDFPGSRRCFMSADPEHNTVEGIVLATKNGLPDQIISPWGRTQFVQINNDRNDGRPSQEFLTELIAEHDLVQLDPLIAIDLQLDPNEEEEAWFFIATDDTIKRDHAKIVLQPSTRPAKEELRVAWQRHMNRWQDEQQQRARLSHLHLFEATAA